MTRSKACQADYHESEILDYRGNPLIEALPRINSPAAASAILQLKPPISDEERHQPTHLRLHYLKRLRKLVKPLPSFFDFESRFSRNIRSGYAARHPNLPEIQAMRYGAAKPGQWYDATLDPYSASELTVVGLSGMGKSTMVEAILRSYPQYIQHKTYNGIRFRALQLVWIKINCPHNGSLSALCRSFFEAVDQATGTTTYKLKYADPRLTVDTLIGGMRQVAATYYLGMLVIDELQNLSVAKAGGSEVMMNYFMNLRAELRVPIVLIGTYKAVELFQTEMRFARRASENGLTDLTRAISWQDETWQSLARNLWHYQWLRKPTELTDRIFRRFFDCSQGVTEILVALFSLAQEVALNDDEGETYGEITDALIQECYDSSLVLLHPSIDALRSNSVRAMQIFEDLLPPGGISGNTRAVPAGLAPEGKRADASPPEDGEATSGAPTTDDGSRGVSGDGSGRVSEEPPQNDQPALKPKSATDPNDLRNKEGMRKAIDEKGKIPGAPM